jgi:hypothetical protein
MHGQKLKFTPMYVFQGKGYEKKVGYYCGDGVGLGSEEFIKCCQI